ncbi:uncharacterized protein Z518_03351 [Rhinocladiella mackenziei CBS 650.93]|uniref:Rhinocladiella mackenziei CBS 650.93 unplaced genomic scaffold supercont1.2, whole genome shotgun sequence n=1 Tax=Rhinocladiella mackenziei CBS 650.93 TaxID=1442369 RepID=A0A0D2IRS5_9EURO|nr:uncharacterized protein Z518_03351 [Rhinocladiella mackenziei CBS 650.93]KIX08694.1 hypothetical protein Z518_03351 [Rhinocladiella mackenziei CBS 650.93]
MTTYNGSAGPFGGIGDSVDDQSARWEALRPVITRLYIDQAMTLADVQQTLERDYQFIAQTHAYKRKLRQWNLVKNLRRKDMKQILQALKIKNEKDLLQRSRNREISVDGHKVRFSDLKRYIRRHQSPRTGSASDDETPTQSSERNHEVPQQTEKLGGSDTMSTMTLPGSPPQHVLGLDDGHSSSLPTEWFSGTTSDQLVSSLPFPETSDVSATTDGKIDQWYQLPQTSSRKTTMILEDVEVTTLGKITNIPKHEKAKVRKEPTHPELFGDQILEDSALLGVGTASTTAGGSERAMDMEASECSSSGPRINLQDSKRLFACPFHKFDPPRYSEQNALETRYRRCSTVVLPSLSRLKQHIWRVHACPDYYCMRCFETFSNATELHSHLTAEVCSPRGSSPFSEKVSHDQMNAIKRRAINRGPEQTWFAIYEILFPRAKKPSSPYVDNGQRTVLGDFITYFEQRVQPMMYDIFKNKLKTMPLDASTEAGMKRIFRDTAEESVSNLSSDPSADTISTDWEHRSAAGSSEVSPYCALPRSSWVDQSSGCQPWSLVAPDISSNCVPHPTYDDMFLHHNTLRANGENLFFSLDDSQSTLSPALWAI